MRHGERGASWSTAAAVGPQIIHRRCVSFPSDWRPGFLAWYGDHTTGFLQGSMGRWFLVGVGRVFLSSKTGFWCAHMTLFRHGPISNESVNVEDNGAFLFYGICDKKEMIGLFI